MPLRARLGVYRSLAFVFASALVSTALEMTGLNTVPLGMRADEGVRPYHALSIVELPTSYCHFDRSVNVVEKSPAEITR